MRESKKKQEVGNVHFNTILLHHLDDRVFGTQEDASVVDSHAFLKAIQSRFVGWR